MDALPSNTTPYAGGKMLAAAAGGVGVITFNQPEKRNAMSVEMWTGLAEILDGFAADPGLRVVVLTGAGDKAFVSGADISQFEQQRGNAEAQKEYDRLTSIGREKLAGFAKPVIARIRGFCMGGGLGIAMQADLRIASTNSQFGIPAAKLGISYGFTTMRRLVALVGPAHARMLVYTGNRIDAAEASRIGLINEAVAPEALDARVMDIARTIAGNAPLSVASMKFTVTEATRAESEMDTAAITRSIATCFDSADYREGRAAFMEKRKPVFTGR
ncbi:MAG: enoyl-CoA hydratase [Rhodospirillales bacterium 70-18]|nr:enoyl-CoA hydratase/isomerase family protein [Rhodospirillales bacterium]OJY70381.1 MAG: enoyl-CoA hydratase [Rhodospirillales bacterium 70-18]